MFEFEIVGINLNVFEKTNPKAVATVAMHRLTNTPNYQDSMNIHVTNTEARELRIGDVYTLTKKEEPKCTYTTLNATMNTVTNDETETRKTGGS